MKYSSALLLAIFLIGVSVSEATQKPSEDGSSATQDAPVEDQKPKEGGASGTEPSKNERPQEAVSPTPANASPTYQIEAGSPPPPSPTAYSNREDDMLAAAGEPPKTPFIFHLIQKGAEGLQKGVATGWSWLTGTFTKSGREAKKLLSLNRAPSDVAAKVDPQE